MKLTARIFLICLMSFGFTVNLAGCAYGLTDCNKYAGTGEYNECLAAKGNRDIQYQLGLEAYEQGDIETAVKWLKKAAAPDTSLDNIYVPAAGGQQTGTVLSFPKTNPYPGHRDARVLLARINSSEHVCSLKCPHEGHHSILGMIIETEKITDYKLEDYLSENELDALSKSDLYDISDRNAFLSRMLFQARIDFANSELGRLGKVYNILSDKIYEYSDEFDVGNRQLFELGDFYYENRFWYHRYRVMMRILFWRWSLSQDKDILKEVEYFEKLHKELMSFLIQRGARSSDKSEDLSNHSIDATSLDFRLIEYDLLYANALTEDDHEKRKQKVGEFLKENPTNLTLEGRRYSRLKSSYENIVNYDVDLVNENKPSYNELYSDFEGYLYYDAEILYHQTSLRQLVGENIDEQLHLFKKFLQFLNPECDVDLWLRVSEYFYKLNMHPSLTPIDNLICPMFSDVETEGWSVALGHSDSIFYTKTVMDMKAKLENENYCAS